MSDSDPTQQTLDGDDADDELITQDDLDSVEFVYFESNVESVLNNHRPAHKEECVKMAIEQFDQSSRVDTDGLTEDEIEDLAESFVDVVFDSVWEQVDGTGYSLWIRHTDIPEGSADHMREFPIYIKNPVGVFCSSFRRFGSMEGNTVSDTFLRAVGQIPEDSEETNGWSNCSDELWEEMIDIEQQLFWDIRNALLGMSDMSVEIGILIEKGQNLLENE